MSGLKEKMSKLDKFKYPLIILILGVILMLLPGKSVYTDSSEKADSPLKEELTCTQ